MTARVATTGRTSVKTALFAFHGNSLTDGTNASSTQTKYPVRTMAGFASSDDWLGVGHPGYTTPMLASLATSEIDPLFSAGRYCVVIFWEIVNELFLGASESDAYQHVVDYCTARKAVGFRVVVLTCMPINSSRPAGFDANRLGVNASIRSNFASYANAVSDVASAPELSDASNLTYFSSDGVHLTDAGYQIAANVTANAIRTLNP